MNRDEITKELRRVAEQLGKRTLARTEFARHGVMSTSAVERAFGSWNKALTAAGLEPDTSNRPLSDEDMETEFRRVHETLGKTPTRSEFSASANHSPTVYEKRFGSWRKVVAHYLGEAAAGNAPRRPPSKPPNTGPSKDRVGNVKGVVEFSGDVSNRRIFGAPLDFRGLRHEPIDEQGVVFLFGMVAHDLGFLVESVRTPFPDCRAKRRVKGGHYVELDIELEYKSSNFRRHGHPPDKCDLIVCWEDDWPDSPVEVLELKSAIAALDPSADD